MVDWTDYDNAEIERDMDAKDDRIEELEAALREISLTTKGYPNASREGEIARAALKGK